MLPTYRRATHAVDGSGVANAARFWCRRSTACARSSRWRSTRGRRHRWDVHGRQGRQTAVRRRADRRSLSRRSCGRSNASWSAASYAVGVYLAMTTNDPVYIGALFAFLMHVAAGGGAADADGASWSISTTRRAWRSAVVGQLVNQPPEEGRTGHGVRTPIEGHVQFSNVTFRYTGAHVAGACSDVSFEVPNGTTLGIMGTQRLGQDDRHPAAAAAAHQLRGADQDRRHRRARI